MTSVEKLVFSIIEVALYNQRSELSNDGRFEFTEAVKGMYSGPRSINTKFLPFVEGRKEMG